MSKLNSMHNICKSVLKISEKVAEAIRLRKPVVALESTIISHGMPYPQNRQCAISIEKQIESEGVVPATIAIFDGAIHVGLTVEQIQRLAVTGVNAKKVSRRDLPQIIASKGIGATTVSSTMIGAHAAGIQVFVTGGIGGVHRGYESTMDVSADLEELGRTPVTVVSAGVKSILDIPRTLQYLETKGVSVATYKSQYFPAFFSSSSGVKSPSVVHSAGEAANLIYAHHQLGLDNGILIAVPNNYPEQGELIQQAIRRALQQSDKLKIKGSEITPFLLKRVNELTLGKSLSSNISLVHNNAKVGASIAMELSKRILNTPPLSSTYPSSTYPSSTSSSSAYPSSTSPTKIIRQKDRQRSPRVITIGGSAIDYQFVSEKGFKFELYKSCVGRSRKTLGGVARNIAECASRLGTPTKLVTALGNDEDSQTIVNFCQKHKIDLYNTYQHTSQHVASPKYFAIMDGNGNELLGISQMQANESLTFDNIYEFFFKKQREHIDSQDIFVIDSNVDEKSLAKIAGFCSQQLGCMTVFEAKGQKSKKVIRSQAYKYISLLKINALQFIEITEAVKQIAKNSDVYEWLARNVSSQCKNDRYTSIRCIKTNGPKEVELIRSNLDYQKFQIFKPQSIQKTTGAGDTFTGAFCAMLAQGKTDEQALRYARAASRISVESDIGDSVISGRITKQNLRKIIQQEG